MDHHKRGGIRIACKGEIFAVDKELARSGGFTYSDAKNLHDPKPANKTNHITSLDNAAGDQNLQ
jgi:hypothetical protein